MIYEMLDSPGKFVGTYYEVPVIYAKNTNAQFYAASATLTNSTTAEVTKAQYAATRSNVAITLEGLDMSLNQGDAKVLNMVKEKVKIAEHSLKSLFGANWWNTTQSNSFNGLYTIAAAGASSLGGISSSDAATWLSSSGANGCAGGPDASTTALTKTLLDKHYNSATVEGEQPTSGVTSASTWSGIMATYLQPLVKYQDMKMAELGFENFTYRGAKFYWDPQAGSGDLVFYNKNHLYFAFVPGYNFKFIDFDYPVNQDIATAHIRTYCQVICESRRQIAWMSALTSVT
jgi:hypothetical protein